MSERQDTVLVGVRFQSKNGHWLAHPDLRPRMVADATVKGTNLTDLAIRILSEKFSVPYADNARRSTASADPSKNQMNLRLPVDLDVAISVAAARTPGVRKVKSPDVIRATLCEHYGLTAAA